MVFVVARFIIHGAILITKVKAKLLSIGKIEIAKQDSITR